MTEQTSGQDFIRRVNDSIYGLSVKLGIEDGEFWCECDDASCEKRLIRTVREYVALGDAPLLSRSHAAELQRT
jgi:hypothetical protein